MAGCPMTWFKIYGCISWRGNRNNLSFSEIVTLTVLCLANLDSCFMQYACIHDWLHINDFTLGLYLEWPFSTSCNLPGYAYVNPLVSSGELDPREMVWG